MQRIVIHCDGSCFPNPGPGAWAAVIQHQSSGQRCEISGSAEDVTTNNRMELTAAIKALEYLSERDPCSVTVYSDSQYLVNGATQWMFRWHRWDWTRKSKGGRDCRQDVVNADLWKQIWALCGIHNVIWEWVRGHSTCAENNRCDALANNQRTKL